MTCNNKGFVVTIGTLLSVAYINFSLMNQDNVNRVGSSFSENPKPILPTYHSNHTVWISMGLCYDEHTKILGKKDYPYQEITPLAIRLWKHFRPEVNVYIKLIRNRQVHVNVIRVQLYFVYKLHTKYTLHLVLYCHSTWHGIAEIFYSHWWVLDFKI